jgi:diguanylate cyclase (GGDEF)-like protein
MAKLFGTYAVLGMVPVLVLGVVLAASYRTEARRRGLAEGRTMATLFADTAIQPQLEGHPLADGLRLAEQIGVQRVVDRAIASGEVLRLRLRDQDGRVVYSHDGSGLTDKPDDESLDAAKGVVVAHLTHTNADANDTGPRGVAAVEVYLPMRDTGGRGQVGVLEMYLPYAPINRDITTGLHSLYRNLALGLAGIYVALFGLTLSVSRGLRRQVKLNAFLAEHHQLTTLPNRALFHRRAAAAVESAAAGQRPIAVAIVDLDRFKDVNDTLGHHNGDYLLTELANRLAEATRADDTVARLGGDEFGLLLRDVSDAEDVLWRLRDLIDREVEVNGLPLSVEASIGFVVAPEDGTDVDELLQRADVAMYVAKAQHAGVVRYDEAFDHYDAANLGLVGELRHAIEAGQLILEYLPMANVDGGEVERMEALVRWEHPVHGRLYPDRFLPLAEQTDVIHRLTEWVLETALTETRDMRSIGTDLTVAVNVSARNLTRPDFSARVADALSRVGVAPARLVIEITETALLTDPEGAAAVLRELRDLGVEVSLDDFGQGQTSLRYLSTLPLNELKIDRGFVSDMKTNPAHAAIVRSIVELGHNLAFRVVAEGVESQEILRALAATGCDVAQGFVLTRPLPADQLNRWLVAQRRAKALVRT